ncbi:hypothetical protein PR202_ga13311 [Eleusine coracana subsp. coracana]|uniref:Uncharacterized protein n=1 Tax=Eleusine coracana subsp. coracana TaxID=191504 RepID=A0AAV5CDQ9_ELECO|nr:hypothetical protein PR202_ga13311 [Eleusine coracana subsp. coracana]
MSCLRHQPQALREGEGEGFDHARRTRTRPSVAEEMMEEGDKRRQGPSRRRPCPDDMLLEVFKRLPPRATWSAAPPCAPPLAPPSSLPAARRAASRPPPRHFGFFRNYAPSPLPPFVPAAGVALDLAFLPVPPALLRRRPRRRPRPPPPPAREHSPTDLKLLVCSPLDKTSLRVPPLRIAGLRLAMCALVPREEPAAFRVVVVLFGDAPNHFKVLVYSSASSAWEAATGPLGRALAAHYGPSVVVGDVVYKLQSEEKYIMAVDAADFKLSAVPLPEVRMMLYAGNHWLGKTGDGRLCFFAIREQLLLVKWVLEAPGKWAEQQPVDLRSLMRPELVGDLAHMKLSAKMGDQLRGCKLVSFAAFCEGTGALFFVMADRVVALDLESGRDGGAVEQHGRVAPARGRVPLRDDAVAAGAQGSRRGLIRRRGGACGNALVVLRMLLLMLLWSSTGLLSCFVLLQMQFQLYLLRHGTYRHRNLVSLDLSLPHGSLYSTLFQIGRPKGIN